MYSKKNETQQHQKKIYYPQVKPKLDTLPKKCSQQGGNQQDQGEKNKISINGHWYFCLKV